MGRLAGPFFSKALTSMKAISVAQRGFTLIEAGCVLDHGPVLVHERRRMDDTAASSQEAMRPETGEQPGVRIGALELDPICLTRRIGFDRENGQAGCKE